MLTGAHLKVLAKGAWTADQVRCEFGPPAQIDQVGLPSVRQVVWSYRYKQSGVWNSLMYVYIGRAGQCVTRFHPRSEARRVGKERVSQCSSRWTPYLEKQTNQELQ